MSADLNTTITLQGTTEELLAMMKVLKRFETEMFEQYKTQHDCGYINMVTVKGTSGECRTAQMTEDAMSAFLADAGKKVVVTAAGPWGVFFAPGEVGLFEALADCAPKAAFSGSIVGFITGADVSHSAELKDGKLYLSDFMMADEELPEIYAKEVKKKLPRAKFCKLFNVDKEEFDSDCYFDFIAEAFDDGFPEDMDYDTFMDYCDCADIDEDQYDAAIEKVMELGIVDMETFRESIEDDYCENRVYDPETKKYSKTTAKK